MKYEKEIDNMFKSIFYDSFLEVEDDFEFNFLINECLKQNNLSKQIRVKWDSKSKARGKDKGH